TAPTVIARTPAANSTGVSTGSTVTATFDESVQPNTISFILKDANNNTVPGSVSYDDTTDTTTFTPTAPLAGTTTYTATLSGATDLVGNVMTSTSWSFTTGAAIPTYALWDTSATPAILSASDTNSVELGVKFTVSAGGSATGARFYKGSANTG